MRKFEGQAAHVAVYLLPSATRCLSLAVLISYIIKNFPRNVNFLIKYEIKVLARTICVFFKKVGYLVPGTFQ